MEDNLNWNTPKTINIITDPPGWFSPFAKQLVQRLNDSGHEASLFHKQSSIKSADISFFLSCTKLTPKKILDRSNFNIVVHASNLPKGRGFSPLVWQILEGQSHIPLTMIIMNEEADAGEILMKKNLVFNGTELNDELRQKLALTIIDMCTELANQKVAPSRIKQEGKPSWYRKRTSEDSKIDPNLTIAEQFNLLRVVDNERYPAFFELGGQRYILKVYKQN